MLLLELFSLAGARMRNTLVKLLSSYTGRERDTTVTSWVVVFNDTLVFLTDKRMVIRCESRYQSTRAIGLSLEVKVTRIRLAQKS